MYINRYTCILIYMSVTAKCDFDQIVRLHVNRHVHVIYLLGFVVPTHHIAGFTGTLKGVCFKLSTCYVLVAGIDVMAHLTTGARYAFTPMVLHS